jgi:hypothetical protein
VHPRCRCPFRNSVHRLACLVLLGEGGRGALWQQTNELRSVGRAAGHSH